VQAVIVHLDLHPAQAARQLTQRALRGQRLPESAEQPGPLPCYVCLLVLRKLCFHHSSLSGFTGRYMNMWLCILSWELVICQKCAALTLSFCKGAAALLALLQRMPSHPVHEHHLLSFAFIDA